MGSFGVAFGNHHRAIEHETVGSDCHDVAYACSSYDFKRGRCADCWNRNDSCMLLSTIGNIVLGLNPVDVKYKSGTLMHISTGWASFAVTNTKFEPN
jgi:hypothetical protein